MSDSDSTWPGTDDFGSRFLEIDEYEQAKELKCLAQQDVSPPLPRFRPHRGSTGLKPDATTKKSSELRANRGVRLRNKIPAKESTNVSENNRDAKPVTEPQTNKRSHRSSAQDNNGVNFVDDDEETDRELSTFRNPKLMTARQLSLKMQRSTDLSGSPTDSSGRTRAMAASTLLTLESLEPLKHKTKPTPEQLFARQQRIERRRESAKRKAEMEKQQTVEKLLKINVNSDGLPKRNRGRGRTIVGHPGFSRPASVSCLSSTVEPSGPEANEEYADGDDNDDNEASDQSDAVELRQVDESTSELDTRRTRAEQHGLTESTMDPPPTYIRWISSSRLTPSSRLCFGSDIISDFINTLQSTPLNPKPPQMCELGCGRLMRYTCSTTGRALCSLTCYKTNLGHTIPTIHSEMKSTCIT